MAFDPKSLTVDFTTLSKLPAHARQNAYAQGLIPEQFLSQLTPTQRASLFPKYFSEALPDVSGFRSATGGTAPTTSPTGTATEAPAGVSAPAGTSQPTVASQNQQAQQAEQAQQGLAGILAPYMPQQAATGQREGKQYKANEKAGELQKHIIRVSNNLGLNPKDLATLISYETAGSMNPYKKGPRTQWGQHRGLIQWGEVQARKYGLDLNPNSPNRSSIEQQMNAVEQYFKDEGFVDWMKKNPNAPLVAVRRAMYATVNAGNPERVNASDAQNGGAPGTVIDKVNEMFRTKGYTHYNKAEKFLKDAIEEVATPTAEEFQEATAQPASKNVFKLNKEKLREAAKKSNLLAGLASDEKIDSEINKKIQSLLPEGASYNPETGEITGNLSIEDITSIVKEKAPEFGDQISKYIQPVGQPLISAAQDELAAQAASTVAMSDDVKTFIDDLPEQARNELSKDPRLISGIDAAIKAGAGDNIKQQIIQKYTEKVKPTATEIIDIVETEKRFEDKGGSIRNLPIPTAIKEKMLYAQEKSGIARVVSVSSGQMSWKEAKSKGARKVGKKWVMPDGTIVGTGSVRHGVDVGAADLQFYDEKGNKLRYDHPQVQEYMKYASAAGLKGQGAGRSYMGDYTVHIGAGTPASWGGADELIDRQLAAGDKIGSEDYLNWREQKIIAANQQQNAKDIIAKEEQEAKEVLKTGAKNLPSSHPLAIKKSNQQTQTQSAPDTSGNIISQAGGTPTPEQAAAQAQATATEAPPKEEKGMIQKAWDWVTGSDNSSEAPLAYGADIEVDQRNPARLIDSMGNEKVIGEAGAEKISVESKYNPQDQNQTLAKPVEPASKNAMDLSQQQPFSDWSQTTLGSHSPTSSMKDAFNYAKFSKGGWSERLYLNGSKNVV